MWLLENTVKDKLEAAYKQNLNISADMHEKYDNRAEVNISTQKSNVAVITIDGILTERPDIIAQILGFGNTTYEEISDALAFARDNDDIDSIQLNINSPGGEVTGLFSTLDILSSINKPVIAVVDNLAASAAYAIAAQADKIIANNRAATVGSVGVVASMFINDSIVSITSTNAPDKRPDVTTEEGKAVVRKNLDAIEALFIESIASGRNTTIEDVKNNFGRGAVLLADDAKSKNMLDNIMTVSVADLQKTNVGATSMNLEDLKPQHADVFVQAKNEGVKQERERVKAHLILAEAYNANDIAFKAIKEGADITPTLQAEYLAVGANKKAIEARVDDNPEAVTSKAKEANIADKLYTKLEERFNV